MKSELLKAARALVDAFGGDWPDWISAEIGALEAAILNEEALHRAEATQGPSEADALMFGFAGLTRTGRNISEPEMQNLPGTGADFVAKMQQRGRAIGKHPALGAPYVNQQESRLHRPGEDKPVVIGVDFGSQPDQVGFSYMQNLEEAAQLHGQKVSDFYAEFAERFWNTDRPVKVISDEDREQYRKEKTARLAFGYSMGADTFHAQMRHAAMWEDIHNKELRAAGWQRHPAGYWWHFWMPGTTINPG